MFSRVIELILRTATLVEAEGRSLKRNTLEVVGLALVWVLATVLALLGVLVLLTAVYLGLRRIMPEWAAVACVGAILLTLALVLGRAVWRAVPNRDTETMIMRQKKNDPQT